MRVHTCNSSIWETEAGRSLAIEFETELNYPAVKIYKEKVLTRKTFFFQIIPYANFQYALVGRIVSICYHLASFPFTMGKEKKSSKEQRGQKVGGAEEMAQEEWYLPMSLIIP